MCSLILKEQSAMIGDFIFLLKMRHFEFSSPKKQIGKIQENFGGEKSFNKTKKYRTCPIYLHLKSLKPFSLWSSVAALT